MSAQTVPALLAPVWTQRRDAVALQTDDRSWTYGELDLAVRRAEAWLGARGLGRGDRLALLLDRGVPFIALYLAALRQGLACVPLNPAATPDEIAWVRKDAEPALTVSTRPRSELLDPAHGPLAWIDDEVPGTAHHDGPPEGVARPRDLAALLYTSGTTGRPKGAMLTQTNLAANLEALHRLWRWSADDVLVHTLPLHHVHGLFVALGGALRAGARTLLRPRFDAAEALSTMERAGATLFMGVPTMYNRFVQLPDEDRFDLSGMRLFISGSAPLSPTTAAAFERRFGHSILERYGMTEVGMATSPSLDGPRPAGSVGHPLPGTTVRLIDTATGHACKTGEVGEVQIQGPGVFAGYWRQRRATAAAFSPDGWLASGDLGRLDAEGRLWLVGRRTELVISGGFNVYPREVEAVLDDHPDVLESAVWGRPDEDLGEVVQAAVVPRPGRQQDDETLIEALGLACRKRLSAYKCPRAIRVVDQLPRNSMGKVQKQRLADAPGIG